MRTLILIPIIIMFILLVQLYGFSVTQEGIQSDKEGKYDEARTHFTEAGLIYERGYNWGMHMLAVIVLFFFVEMIWEAFHR